MSSYTRCPHCDTAFVVTEEHLQMADGKVRCGSCKSIFNAREFILDLPNEEAEEEAEVEVQIPVLEESALNQNYDNPDLIQATGEAVLNTKPQQEESSPVVLDTQSELPNSGLEIREHADSEEYVQIDMVIESIIEPSTEVQLPDDAVMEIKDDADMFVESLENLQLAETDPDARENVVDSFTKPEKQPSKTLQKLFWTLGGLILVFVIVSAIFWMKRQELAKDDRWRPTIDKICLYINCGIPARRDISRVELQNREVRYGDDNITVNLLLMNTADFEQGYPRIEMTLSDLDGNVLSTHLVLPAEYLRSDLVGRLMPKNVPVHIEFNLAANTEVVVGYEFKFL